jgi:hypothetical protein
VILAEIFGLALSALVSFLTVAGCTLFLLPVSSAAIVAHPTLESFASSICVRRRKLSKPRACPLSAPYRNSRLLEQDGFVGVCCLAPYHWGYLFLLPPPGRFKDFPPP